MCRMIRKKTKYINSSLPLVSFLTPTKDRPEWLRITLQSLLSQTYEKIEVILVNDAGIDVSNVVKEFNDSRIKYIVNPINFDLAGSRNAALSHASGDFYVMCDDDDIVYKEGIEYRISLIKKYNANVIYTHALRKYYHRTETGYQEAGTSLYWHSENIKDLLLIQNCCPCTCLMWSRKAQEKAGLFDTSLKTSEDWAHSVEMRQHFEFFDSDIIDCCCSWRDDNSQMTGSRTGFTDHLPYLYGKWRKYAEDYEMVVNAQNNSLRARGLNPSDYGL